MFLIASYVDTFDTRFFRVKPIWIITHPDELFPVRITLPLFYSGYRLTILLVKGDILPGKVYPLSQLFHGRVFLACLQPAILKTENCVISAFPNFGLHASRLKSLFHYFTLANARLFYPGSCQTISLVMRDILLAKGKILLM